MSIVSVNMISKILAGPVDVNIILPNPHVLTGDPQTFYSSQKKYRVLWLMHGGNCDCNSWISYTNLVRYVNGRDLIVVMPTGLNTDFANHVQFTDGFMMTDFFFEELMPFVYGWLPASREREDNFLAGYSMGGAAAWMLGLYRPECFAKIFPLGSPPKDYTFLEPYRTWSAAKFREEALGNPKRFPAGYGDPKAGIHLKEVNMITKYPAVGDYLDSYEHTWDRVREAVQSGALPEVYLLCDTGERTYPKVKQFQECAEAWNCPKLHFEYTDKGLNEYAFCDDVLPRVLELCTG